MTIQEFFVFNGILRNTWLFALLIFEKAVEDVKYYAWALLTDVRTEIAICQFQLRTHSGSHQFFSISTCHAIATSQYTTVHLNILIGSMSVSIKGHLIIQLRISTLQALSLNGFWSNKCDVLIQNSFLSKHVSRVW